MTETEQLADLIALSIHAAVEPLRIKIAALEQLAPIPGPAGKDGPQGEPGPMGAVGPQGLGGKDGSVGLQGPPGMNGKDGTNGVDGKDAMVDPMLLADLTTRLVDVEIKSALAERVERDLMSLKRQVLQTKSAADEIPADRLDALVTDLLTRELAALQTA